MFSSVYHLLVDYQKMVKGDTGKAWKTSVFRTTKDKFVGYKQMQWAADINQSF